MAIRAHRHRLHAALVAPAGTAVFVRIAIEDFAPETADRHTDQKVATRNRREIAHHQQRCAIAYGLTQERDNADFCIAGGDPLEAVG